MAQVERQKEERRDARSTARSEKLKKLTQHRDPLPFESWPWAEMLEAIKAVVMSGGAIRIGQSRDGGAWAFGLYSEHEMKTIYCNAQDDPFATIAQIVEAFSG